jgi:molybdenum cofactor biosynthesis enzyme MoaA
MKTAENLSLIAGTGACNAHCPFCVSKMTGLTEVGLHPQPINWRNFEKAALLAKDYHVSSVIITGKGEPTLFPNQITDYLTHLEKYNFPLIDLQTNGLNFDRQSERFDPYLHQWYDQGLAFVALSIVNFLPEDNRKIYTPSSKRHLDLPRIVDKLHQIGFSVRFSVTLFNGGIDNGEKTGRMIEFAQGLAVEQLTLRKIALPSASASPEIGLWTQSHLLTQGQQQEINRYLTDHGHQLSVSHHGAVIYDVSGQNICLTNALTLDMDPEKIRQIIFYPNGRIRFDWQYSGSTIL